MLQMGIYSTLHRLIIKYQNFRKTLQFFWIFLLSDIMSPCFSTTPKRDISMKFHRNLWKFSFMIIPLLEVQVISSV